MKRAVLLSAFALAAAVIVLPACHLLKDKGADVNGKEASGTPAGGPPPLPPYQMRAQVDDADRLHPTSEGQALFSNHCGACHLAAGMGTNLIGARQAAAGQTPVALLADRKDLTADYVRAVVRSGKGSMPRQTRVDVTDAELDRIATFLGKGK